MTTKELTEIVTKQGVTLSEMNAALAQMAHNSLILHESVKSLETIARAHDTQIEQMINDRKEIDERMKAMNEHLDQRIGDLVSAIGELIRKKD